MSKGEPWTLEDFLARYTPAPAELRHASLIAAARVLDGDADTAADEPFLSLKELASALGYKHYTTLARLEIQRVGESWGGGRLRYRRSVAETYLRSAECMAIREELRRKRRTQEGRGA